MTSYGQHLSLPHGVRHGAACFGSGIAVPDVTTATTDFVTVTEAGKR